MCTGSLRIAKGAGAVAPCIEVRPAATLRSRCASGTTCRRHGAVSAEMQQRGNSKCEAPENLLPTHVLSSTYACSEAVGSAIVLEARVFLTVTRLGTCWDCAVLVCLRTTWPRWHRVSVRMGRRAAEMAGVGWDGSTDQDADPALPDFFRRRPRFFLDSWPVRPYLFLSAVLKLPNFT
jgi:hypothetical protein